ncbi:MAG: imidazole glycerol phosphate synthase subunit HisH [Syntrophales bacterium]|jgi:glutamine amidotransferase|nr:imidazole glycerol phosphate synthase subunit HisH [Syntrophales bacterium]MDY0043957.1 imidazole glycerol phosphate synthase subunit HisH [Syntrophales bacterium]
MISILNYGMGNLASIKNMLKKVGVSAEIIENAKEVDEAQALIIPGVGKFDNAMQSIKIMGLHDALNKAALERKIPILGICLGMQLMTRSSEEGKLSGLGWIEADCRLIKVNRKNFKIPHMGWNTIEIQKVNPYFDGNFTEHRFYFVHSYSAHCDSSADILTTTQYAGEFVSAFSSGNLVGVQFHPEKSHKFGASFFRCFAEEHKLFH